MKPLNILFVACLVSTVAGISVAGDEPYVDVRDVVIHGKVVNVDAPNLLKIASSQNNVNEYFWVEPVNVDYGEVRDLSCDGLWHQFNKKQPLMDELKRACAAIKSYTKHEPVSIEVVQWQSRQWRGRPVVRGNVFIGTTHLNHELIGKGVFPVDYKETRDTTLVLLEKNARCQRLGIWSDKIGDIIDDMKCQD